MWFWLFGLEDSRTVLPAMADEQEKGGVGSWPFCLPASLMEFHSLLPGRAQPARRTRGVAAQP